MLKRNLGLYGGLLLLCQLLLSCNSQNNDALVDSGADAGENGGAMTAQDTIAKKDDGAGDDAAPAAGEPTQIIAFGDSLYAGYGLGPKEGLAPILQQRLRSAGYNVSVRNAGVSGDTSAGGLRRLNFLLNSDGVSPRIFMLGLGGNDMLRGIRPAETRGNLDKMLAELKQRDIDVIITGMLAAPNLGPDYTREFNAIYPQLANKYGATLYPFILDGVVADKKLMLADNIHPSAQGVIKMTDGLLPLIEKRLDALGSEPRMDKLPEKDI